MSRRLPIILVLALLSASPFALANRVGAQAQESHALAAGVMGAPISLPKALAAVTGTPISAKFEMENGQLQLSVYTMQNGKYFEVIVNHRTGVLAESKEITDGEDLAAAKAQGKAITLAKRSLGDAASSAVTANKDYRVLRIVPSLKAAKPVAEITLVKGDVRKTVREPLN